MQLRSLILIALSLAITLAVFIFVDPIAQNPAYHQFADQRYLNGMANFHNTISSAAFLMTGCVGLLALGSLPMGIARGRAPWFNAVTWFFIFVGILILLQTLCAVWTVAELIVYYKVYSIVHKDKQY